MQLKPRFETSTQMFMVGKRVKHNYHDAMHTIPVQWAEFTKLLPINDSLDADRFGIMCGNFPQLSQFEYMTAVEVRDFDETPNGMDKLIIPVQRYAVFEHNGHISDIRSVWEYAWNEWLPKSGYVSEEVPEFEKYDNRYDPISGNGIVEIWISIARNPDLD